MKASISSRLFPLILCLLLFVNFSCKKEELSTEQEEEKEEVVSSKLGCNDWYASNFDSNVKYSDNSCAYVPVECSDCDYVLEPNDFKLDNEELNLPIGSKIGIKGGARIVIDIRNFQGTKEKPYIFTNCNGQAVLSISDSPEAIKIRNSSHIRLTGTGSSDIYGIKIEMGSQGVRAYEKTDHVEIDHIEISGVGVGIWAVTRPTCDGKANRGNYVQENTIIHHNYIHDVHGEGMYIGGSKWEHGFDNNECPGEKLYQADLIGVRVFNNLVENTGWDGIQVGGAIEDCELFNNVVRNYGLLEAGPHQAGMMINPGTTGKIFSNLIEGGTGNAIHILGFDNLVHSNLIIDCQMNAIHIGDRNPLVNKSYRVLNNSLINIAGKALNLNSNESINNVFYNNFMANIGDEKLYTAVENTEMLNNIITSSVEDYPFMDVLKWDLTPTLESDLLNSGTFYDRDEISVDFLMRDRLIGSNLDIGAFENQKGDN